MLEADRDKEHLASRVGVQVDVFDTWLAGTASPTVAQLRTIAKACRKPFAVFFLSEAPPHKPMPTDRRSLPGPQSALSEKAVRAVREAQRLQAVASELFATTDRQALSISGLDPTSPESLAEGFRESLHIEPPSPPLKPDLALKLRMRLVEERVGLVLRMSMGPAREVRGMSLPGDVPVILLNTKDSENGQSFSLIHELAHIALKQDGICLGGETAPDRTDSVEVFCNRVAAETLVPMDELLRTAVVASHETEGVYSDPELMSLARTFSVSRQVVLTRLRAAELVTQSDYELKMSELSEGQVKKATGGGANTWVATLLNRAGERLTGLVLDSVRNNVMTEVDAAQALDTRVAYLPRVEEALLTRRSAL
jgi:Zn-dependent peptidase ImmA (M78 family)